MKRPSKICAVGENFKTNAKDTKESGWVLNLPYFVVPAWTAGSQADMDVSRSILRAWMPATHAGMTEAVVNEGDKVESCPCFFICRFGRRTPFALKFVQEDQIEKTGHLLVVLAERRK
jgi:hypothetical protein